MTSAGAPRGSGPGFDREAGRRADVAALRSALSGLADGDATPTRRTNQPECRATRAAMRDYIKGRLIPSRQRRVAAHLDRCAPCTRAFIDVREASWTLRDLGRRLAVDSHPGGRHRRASSSSRA